MAVINIREVKISDLARCDEIETISYQGDEAASKDKILTRITNYPEGFIVLEVNGEIAGFINSGATHVVELENEEFKELKGHDADGEHIVIMSVVVHPDYQGSGYANMLMDSFIAMMQKLNKSSIHLICQTSLVKMYEKQSFSYECESKSTHGGMKWHEMSLQLKSC
ncbi:MAG: GNAT family N-acetyltransferase [Alcanivoracaceae bacterium]|nr:GNAT family N-acetyltransferase [Alcanivoracaceae bacterium]